MDEQNELQTREGGKRERNDSKWIAHTTGVSVVPRGPWPPRCSHSHFFRFTLRASYTSVFSVCKTTLLSEIVRANLWVVSHAGGTG